MKKYNLKELAEGSNNMVLRGIGAILKHENKIWFFPTYFNGLFSIDLVDDMLTFHGRVPGEKEYGKCLYYNMIYYSNSIILVPFFASTNDIVIFDISEGTFKKMVLVEKLKYSYFSNAFLYKKYLFLFPSPNANVTRIDLERRTVQYVDSIDDKIKTFIFDTKEPYYEYQSVLMKDDVYIPFANANVLLKLNCKDLSYELIEIGKEAVGYSGCCAYDDILYLAPRRANGQLVQYSKGNIKKIQATSKNNRLLNNKLFADGEKVLIFSSSDDLEMSNENIRVISNVHSICVAEKHLFGFNNHTSELFIDYLNGEMKSQLIKVPFEWTSFMKELSEGNAEELDECSMECFFNFINNDKMSRMVNRAETTGGIIYKYLKSINEFY